MGSATGTDEPTSPFAVERSPIDSADDAHVAKAIARRVPAENESDPGRCRATLEIGRLRELCVRLGHAHRSPNA